MTPPEATGGRRLPLIGAAVAVLLLLLAWLAVAKSLRDLRSSKEREQSLEARIAEADRKIDGLRNRIVRLHDDPGLIERLAREELGFVRPRDVIIELPLPVKAVGAAVKAKPGAPPFEPFEPPFAPAEAPSGQHLPTHRPDRRLKSPAPVVLPPSDAPPTPE